MGVGRKQHRLLIIRRFFSYLIGGQRDIKRARTNNHSKTGNIYAWEWVHNPTITIWPGSKAKGLIMIFGVPT